MTETKKAEVKSGSGDSNLYGALAYLLTIITGVVMLLIKPEDKYVKFHAMQSILFGVAMFVLIFALVIVSGILALIPVIGWIFVLLIGIGVPLFSLAVFILWLFLMWKAYSGEKFKLPLIGAQAEKMSQ